MTTILRLIAGILPVMLLLASCNPSPNNYAEDLRKGKEVASESFMSLSSAVKSAMQRGGVQEAVSYCNVASSPLIDSLSTAYNAAIRRTSFHFRNPSNKPSEAEESILVHFQKITRAGEKPNDTIIYAGGGGYTYYAPIVIENPLCLVCHGQPGSTMPAENADFITSIYPEDRATGFEMGDLRGMWSIEFHGNTQP